MAPIRHAFYFIRHCIQARRWDAFHSPYLFELFSYSCHDKNRFPLFGLIEKQRHLFLRSQKIISRIDYGAGPSLERKSLEVPLSKIAKSTLSLPFQCRFMARLARFMSPGTILELGTSLGIATAYFSAGAPNCKIITVEGDPGIARVAKSLFSNLDLTNIILINETFENFLADNLPSGPIDLVFIDGNHRKDSLIQYYTDLKKKFKPNSIVVVDDIYWSKGMHLGWLELTHQVEVTQSVDCFHFGLLFFKPDFLNKEHHLVRLPFFLR